MRSSTDRGLPSSSWTDSASRIKCSKGSRSPCLRKPEVQVRLPASSPRAPWRLKRVLEYIDATRDHEVGLAELASVAGLSPHHFARSFKEVTGSTAHRFVLERRLEVATHLLANTDVRVGEVARRLGFSTAQHFSNAFRRVIGSTPSAYRADHRP